MARLAGEGSTPTRSSMAARNRPYAVSPSPERPVCSSDSSTTCQAPSAHSSSPMVCWAMR